MLNTNWNFGVELEFGYGNDQYALARKLTEWFATQGVSRVCVGKPYGHSNSRTEWTCKPDGSVNAGYYGLELVPPVLTGEAGLWELACVVDKFLGPMARANEISVDTSCGLHVHHSSSGLTETEIKRVYNAYINDGGITEHALYAKCSAHRQNNGYCRKAHYRNMKPQFETMSQGGNGLRDFNITDARYFGLNINSYWVRGTVEFRMHHGTLDAQEIVDWVRYTATVLGNLINGVERTTTESVETLRHRGQANWIDEAMRAGNLTVTEIARVTGYSRARIQLHIHHIVHRHGFNPLRG